MNLSRLGRRCVLAPNAGLYVSPLQLGNIGFEDGPKSGRSIDKNTAFELLDAFYEAGGNFIDTSQNCHGLSEEWVGEWAEQRRVRDQLVIATKYHANLKGHDNHKTPISGNNVKSMVLSLEVSLKNLRTSYIDILYVDHWEWTTPVEEVMNGLHNLVIAGKVFYLGLSNSPSWLCSKANMYARAHGKTQFVIYQGNWDMMDLRPDIVQMAAAEGMALSLGNISSATDLGDVEEGPKMIFPHSLERVSKEIGVEHASAVVIAYLLQKTSHVFPVIGGLDTQQLFSYIQGLSISLSSEHVFYLDYIILINPLDEPVNEGTNNAPRSDEARAVALAWLKVFAEATASGNAREFATKLFKPDGWFRDVLIFTWDNRTLRGHEKIVSYLERSLAAANITNVVLDETPELRPASFDLPFGQGIEFAFRFETPTAVARGFTRLLPTSSSEMKALSVYVGMEDLKGHEETGAETGLYGGHTITWNEVLEQRRTEVESDPHVVIVGGGHSGLQVAARFKQMNIKALIVEKNQRIGDNWRKRYPSLTLHTPKYFSSTLYQPFPRNFPFFIPRDKIADWLEYYAKAQDLVVWTNSQILPRATYDPQEKRWSIEVDRNGTKVTLRPKHVVIATGVHGLPHIPVIPNIEKFRGEVLHTSQYLGGEKFAGLRVVVIGAGNSSADICQDLSFRGAASVTMVQRSKTCVVSSKEMANFFAQACPEDSPIEISDFRRASLPFGMMKEMARATMDQVLAGDKEMLEGLRKTGFQTHYGEDNTGLVIMYYSRGGGYWIDVGCAELIAKGKVAVRCGVEPISFTDTGVVFDDGTEMQVDAVIFATGYTSWKDRMKDIFDPNAIESTKDIWGLDNEDEMCGAYRPTGYPALWFAVGDFADGRICSKQLALHIKAEELNLKEEGL